MRASHLVADTREDAKLSQSQGPPTLEFWGMNKGKESICFEENHCPAFMKIWTRNQEGRTQLPIVGFP